MAQQITISDTAVDEHCLAGLGEFLDTVRDDALVKCSRGYAHDGCDVSTGDAGCCRCDHVHDVEEPCPADGVSCGRIDCCQP